jgi:NADH-quinone oxidoreductase subunit J
VAEQVTFFFWVFAIHITVAGVLAITRRSGVASALWAAVAFLGVAGQFVLMQAYFLAVVEVLVYAGAIMVLFLFVIMLINVREEDLKALETPRLHVAGFLFALGFLGALVWTCRRAGLYEEPIVVGEKAGETANLAGPLFLDYLLPFEIVSFLLLAAIVGAVLITKRRLR